MNRNGVSINEKKTILTIGLHVEAIDDDGNWCESEIINIIDNKIVVQFLKSSQTYNRLLEISSDKWRPITDSQKLNNFALNDDFKKGDCVLAKWRDGNYYLSQILDISSKTKFGTKVKEYHIVYLYDNVEEKVSQSRLKSTASGDINSNTERSFKNSQLMTPTNNIGKRQYRKRINNDYFESRKASDSVFYDEKTKRFTESCKIRRLRLSQVNEKDKDTQDYDVKDIAIKVDKEEPVFDLPKDNLNPSNSTEKTNSKQRFSQRKRRSSFKKADYFYPDSFDHSVNDNKSSNNVSQVSTPVIHEGFDEISKSPKVCTVFSNQNLSEPKEYGHSSNHSPLSVSLTSTEESPKQKQKLEYFQSEVESKVYDEQSMYSCNDDGQYLCLICTNKTFRKKKLVLEHIKYYHPKECNVFNETVIQPIPKSRYTPNKRYYSSYLKTNRSTLERKKHFSKINKVKYKPFISRPLWNTRTSNTPDKSSFLIPQRNDVDPIINDHYVVTNENVSSNFGSINSNKKQSSSIIYCHRCKKSNEDGCLVQCDVCLCWSHTLCYGLSENKDNSNFWECDSCANINLCDGKKTLEWHRDRWRFHSVPQNELPWMPKSASSKSQSSIKNICEIQSLLSLCQRVLESITRSLDKLVFKAANDSNSQDDLDIFKSLYVYDNIDEIPRIETLDVLNADNEELFKISCPGRCNNVNGNSTNKQVNQTIINNHSNFHFNEINFANSTPIKAPVNGHKSINTSLDGILDCDIQKLDIIPKADFDALVKDLNSCGEIYKKNSCEHHSKVGLLDFIDDNCNMNNPDKHIDIPVSLDSDMPFSQSVCLYPNPETNPTSEPIIYLPNDYLDNLFEKEPPKEITLCTDICDLAANISSIKKYSKDDSLLTSSCSDFESKSSDLIASTSSFEQMNFSNSKPNEEIHKINQADCKLEIEFSDLNAIIQPESSSIDPNTSSVFADTEMRLTPSDSKYLHWLLSKFQCVEKIVESVEETIHSMDSLTNDQSSTNLESEHSRISKYLQSLLYILKKN